jgi:hypothetical protein
MRCDAAEQGPLFVCRGGVDYDTAFAGALYSKPLNPESAARGWVSPRPPARQVGRKLNNFNARCLASIYIGHRNTEPAERAQLIKEFCTPIGTVSQSGTVGRSTFNLIAHLRAWRLRWF